MKIIHTLFLSFLTTSSLSASETIRYEFRCEVWHIDQTGLDLQYQWDSSVYMGTPALLSIDVLDTISSFNSSSENYQLSSAKISISIGNYIFSSAEGSLLIYDNKFLGGDSRVDGFIFSFNTSDKSYFPNDSCYRLYGNLETFDTNYLNVTATLPNYLPDTFASNFIQLNALNFDQLMTGDDPRLAVEGMNLNLKSFNNIAIPEPSSIFIPISVSTYFFVLKRKNKSLLVPL